MQIIYIILGLIFLNSHLQAEFTPHLLRSDAHLCTTHAIHHERTKKIPPALLSAISKVESGRYHGPTNQTYAWPWTINVGGAGRFFATKAEAVSHVANLLARGVNSIDVGCMQVNLRYHPNAFHNIEAAFDPQINTEYAARYLTDLKNNLGSWHKAVAHYHSANEIYHVPYREKVYDIWSKEKGGKFAKMTGRGLIPYNRYNLSDVPRGKLYKRVLTSNGHAWQLSDARCALLKYKSRAMNTLAQHQNNGKITANQDTNHQKSNFKQVKSSLTSRLIRKIKQYQPSITKNLIDNSR